MSIELAADDPDRPVDQFVDELLDRLEALQALLGEERVVVEPDAARRAGQVVVAGLRSERAPMVASQLIDALWSTRCGGRAPSRWLTTPLGELVGQAVAGHRPDG